MNSQILDLFSEAFSLVDHPLEQHVSIIAATLLTNLGADAAEISLFLRHSCLMSDVQIAQLMMDHLSLSAAAIACVFKKVLGLQNTEIINILKDGLGLSDAEMLNAAYYGAGIYRNDLMKALEVVLKMSDTQVDRLLTNHGYDRI